MTPTDIAGLSERLRHGHANSGIGPRDCKDALEALDSLTARVKELEAEAFGNELLKNTYRNECAMAVNRALRAEQQRDEAYERAARVCDETLLPWDTGSLILDRETAATIAAAIRRLASGPEGASQLPTPLKEGR